MRRKVLVSELEKQLKPIAERLDSLENRVGRLETEVAAYRSQAELLNTAADTKEPEIPFDEILTKLDYVLAELRNVRTYMAYPHEPRAQSMQPAPRTQYMQPEPLAEYERQYSQTERQDMIYGRRNMDAENVVESGGNAADEEIPAAEYSEQQGENSTRSDNLPPERLGQNEIYETGDEDISDVDFVKVDGSAVLKEEKAPEEIPESRRENPLLSDTQVFSNTRLLPFLEGREFVVVRDRKKPATVRFDRSAEGRGIVRYADNRLVSIFSTPKFLGEYYNLGKTRDISAVSVCGSEYSFPRSGDISEQAVFKFVVEDGVLCLYLSTRVWGDEEKGFVYGNDQVVKLARVD